MKARVLAILIAVATQITQAKCSDATSASLLPGQTKSIYWQFNLKGSVYLSIRSKQGVGCVYLFWKYYPFNQIVSLGNTCGDVTLELPSSWSALGATLWGRADGVETVQVVGASSEEVARKFPKIEFP